MESISVKFILILLMAGISITLVSSKPEMGIHDLSFLGTVEGKSYFMDQNYTNWAGAKQRCEGAGMHLATITSSAQLSLLKTQFNATMGYYYWTGARDSQTPSQFVWDYNNESLSTSVFTEYTAQIGIQTCVAYRATSETTGGFYFNNCESSRYILCEIIHN